MAHLAIEQVRVRFLNAKNLLLANEAMWSGSVDEASVHVRKFIARAVALGATAMIIVHNHPSGAPSPSSRDIRLTCDLVEAGRHMPVTVHDHVIVGAAGRTSMRARPDLGRRPRPPARARPRRAANPPKRTLNICFRKTFARIDRLPNAAPGQSCRRRGAHHGSAWHEGTRLHDLLRALRKTYIADMLDDIIDECALLNKGAYTSVGTYPFQEMVALVTALVGRSGQSLPAVLEDFGRACFGEWVHYVPADFDRKDLFDVLEGIDHFHETDVRKLYPDAKLPSFSEPPTVPRCWPSLRASALSSTAR